MKHVTHALALLFSLVVLLGSQPGKNARPDRPIIFIMDASGSMAADFGGLSRMEAARQLLRDHMGRLGTKTPLGLVAYGNRIPGCRSHRLYSRVQPGNQATISQQVSAMVPEGATPLAATLKLVRKTLLPKYPDANIVVISDGAESCGGDPTRVARELYKSNPDLNINVIGLQLNDDARKQLTAVARAGNGRYFEAGSKADFARALRASMGMGMAGQSKSDARTEAPRPSSSHPGGWQEPEEPYLVDPMLQGFTGSKPPANKTKASRNDRHGQPRVPRDEHGSYENYEHPASR